MPSVTVVAEIGSNWRVSDETETNLASAIHLIREAAACGANIAKFQLFRAADLCHPTHPAYETVRAHELPREWLPKLQQEAREAGIEFTATACDFEAVDLLAELGVPFIKIASGDITYHNLIRYAAKTGRPLVLSTGGATRDETHAAFRVIGQEWEAQGLIEEGESVEGRLTVLHCTMAYPASVTEANLRVLDRLTYREWTYPWYGGWYRSGMFGFSDHTLSTTLPAVAVGLGAVMVEKHFMLSRQQEGPDHAHSLEPDEFRRMVEAIRETEVALGDGEKRVLPCEEEIRPLARRSPYVIDGEEKWLRPEREAQ